MRINPYKHSSVDSSASRNAGKSCRAQHRAKNMHGPHPVQQRRHQRQYLACQRTEATLHPTGKTPIARKRLEASTIFKVREFK
jgi:hypothetical protein